MGLTKDEVASVLRSLGYAPPEPDLTEIWHRLNALVEAMRAFDDDKFYATEPWPAQPFHSPYE